MRFFLILDLSIGINDEGLSMDDDMIFVEDIVVGGLMKRRFLLFGFDAGFSLFRAVVFGVMESISFVDLLVVFVLVFIEKVVGEVRFEEVFVVDGFKEIFLDLF